MSKETSYQRLKRENKELKRDLYNITMHPQTDNGVASFLKWRIHYEILGCVMFGEPDGIINGNTFYFDGIRDKIK